MSGNTRAAEFVEVVRGLFDSWDEDALPRDKESGIYFDRSKVHSLNYVGKAFPRFAGPLDVRASAARTTADCHCRRLRQCNGACRTLRRHELWRPSPISKPHAPTTPRLKHKLHKYARTHDEMLMMPGIQCYVWAHAGRG